MNVWGGIVNKLGEPLEFDNQILKASLKESTRATYSLVNRAYMVEGQCYIGNPNVSVGDYFKRISDDNSLYFINTIISEPLTEDLIYMFAIKCNAKVQVKRFVDTVNEYGDRQREWTDIHNDVDVCLDIILRSDKATNDGGISQVIYTMVSPSQFVISADDRVVIKSNQNGEVKDLNLKVESTGSQIKGICVIQLSVDLRE